MKRPPRTVVLAAALISGVAVAALILCTTLFLRSYRSAVVEGARTNSAQVVSQVAGAVDNYVNTMDSAVGIVLEQLDSEPAMRDAFLNAFLTARPEVAAITTYDESGSLLDCWAQAGRTPKSDILRNLSFDLTTARRLGHGYISTPHVESIFDSYYPWVVSVIRAVPGDGGSSRWLAVDLSFKELAATINNVSIGQHGYCYLMDERGNMVYHPQQQLLYAGLKKEEAGRLACLGDGTYVEDTVIYSVQRVPGSTWRVVGVSYIDETVNESFRQMVRITVITAGLVFLAALVAGWVLSRLLSRPLQQLETAMEQFEQHAEAYLQIQKYRYKNQFTYHFTVDESCLHCLCNKITLQPIIENAIVHGLDLMVDSGHIEITVKPDGNDILLIVADDGIGMEPEQVAALLQNEPSDRTGIGVKNVNDRLRIYFGADYGISIESAPYEGTTVTIRTPRVPEDREGDYDKNH